MGGPAKERAGASVEQFCEAVESLAAGIPRRPPGGAPTTAAAQRALRQADDDDRWLRSGDVVALGAGGSHWAAVTRGGDLYTVGSGRLTGHACVEDVLAPRRLDLRHAGAHARNSAAARYPGFGFVMPQRCHVARVACGFQHTVLLATLAFVELPEAHDEVAVQLDDGGIPAPHSAAASVPGGAAARARVRCVSTEVYTFGGGRGGALGHGDDRSVLSPRRVEALSSEPGYWAGLAARAAGGAVADEPPPPAGEARDRLECTVCMAAERSVLFVPCGHAAACAGCAAELDECPICRAAIVTKQSFGDDDDDDDDDGDAAAAAGGTTTDAVVGIAAGMFASAVVTAAGRLLTFGVGEMGRLGNGDDRPRLLPTEVGGALAAAAGGRRVTAVAMNKGGLHSAALTADGALFTWGFGRIGQLGHLRSAEERRALDDDRANAGSPPVSPSTPSPDEALYSNASLSLPKELPLGERVAVVALGAFHSAAVTEGGRLFTWGENRHGQLGRGVASPWGPPREVTGGGVVFPGRVRALTCGSSSTVLVTHAGLVFGAGKLGAHFASLHFVDVAAGGGGGGGGDGGGSCGGMPIFGEPGYRHA